MGEIRQHILQCFERIFVSLLKSTDSQWCCTAVSVSGKVPYMSSFKEDNVIQKPRSSFCLRAPLCILGTNKNKLSSEGSAFISKISPNFTHLQNCAVNLMKDISEVLSFLFSNQHNKSKKTKQETGKQTWQQNILRRHTHTRFLQNWLIRLLPYTSEFVANYKITWLWGFVLGFFQLTC